MVESLFITELKVYELVLLLVSTKYSVAYENINNRLLYLNIHEISSINISIQFCNDGVTRTLLGVKYCIVFSYIMCNPWRCSFLKMDQSQSKYYCEILM